MSVPDPLPIATRHRRYRQADFWEKLFCRSCRQQSTPVADTGVQIRGYSHSSTIPTLRHPHHPQRSAAQRMGSSLRGARSPRALSPHHTRTHKSRRRHQITHTPNKPTWGSPSAAIRGTAYGLVPQGRAIPATSSLQGGCGGSVASDRSGMHSARRSPTSQSRQFWQSARCFGVLRRPFIQPSATGVCWHAPMLSFPA